MLVCQIWHTQYPYWAVYWISIFNEVLLSAERFIAIFYPFHIQYFKKLLCKLIIIMYLVFIFARFPVLGYSEYDYNLHACISRKLVGIFTFLRWYGLFSTIIAYVVPIFCFLLFTGLSVRCLTNKRTPSLRSSSMNASGVTACLRDRAAVMLLKMSLSIAISFVVTNTFTRVYFTIQLIAGGYFHFSDIVSQIGVGLATTHFSTKPFLIMAFMPGLKRFLIKHILMMDRNNRSRNVNLLF